MNAILLIVLLSVPTPRVPSRIRVEPIPQEPSSPWFSSAYEEVHFPWSGRYRRELYEAQRKGEIDEYRKMNNWVTSSQKER